MAIKRIAMKHHPNIYVYETKRGKRYSVRRRFKDYTGDYQTYTKSGFMSWQDAENNLKQFETRLFDGTLAKAQSQTITLDAYFEILSERKTRMHVWKVSTAATVTGFYKNIISPAFGSENIQSISRLRYQRFIDKLVESKKYAKRTIQTINQTMQEIMNEADLNDVIDKNRLKQIDIVGGRQPKNQALSKDQYNSLISTAKKILTKYDYAMLMLMTLGERRGELLGMRKHSFKFEHDEVNGHLSCWITFDYARTDREPDGTGLKTGASYRTIFVSGEYAELAKYAIDHARDIMEEYHRDTSGNYFIWVSPINGEPISLGHPKHLLNKIAKITGIEAHPHMFRHYFATQARSKNLAETDIMHWLGHSNISMTDSYTRETPEGAANIFKGMDLLGDKAKVARQVTPIKHNSAN